MLLRLSVEARTIIDKMQAWNIIRWLHMQIDPVSFHLNVGHIPQPGKSLLNYWLCTSTLSLHNIHWLRNVPRAMSKSFIPVFFSNSDLLHQLSHSLHFNFFLNMSDKPVFYLCSSFCAQAVSSWAFNPCCNSKSSSFFLSGIKTLAISHAMNFLASFISQYFGHKWSST